jgi:protein SCO1
MPPAARMQYIAASLVGRPALWVILVTAIGAWPLAWSFLHPLPPPQPVLGRVPDFALVDEQGRTFGTKDLAGRVWVAGVIAGQAPGSSRTAARMAQIQDRARQLALRFHLVSLSADPEHDTPERMLAYARASHASPRMWSFLTGPTDAVLRAFAEAAGRPQDDLREVVDGSPTSILALVDVKGRIRACYDADASNVVDRVVRDAAVLVNRPEETNEP